MKPVFKSFLIALGVASLLPLLAQAQPAVDGKPGHCRDMAPPGHPMPEDDMMSPGAPLPPFLHGINLTETQRDQIFDILHAQAPAVREKIKTVRKAQETLQALAMSVNYDEAQAKDLAETIADGTATLALLHAQGESRIYALLTPEQRKKIEDGKASRGFRPANAKLGGTGSGFRAI